MSIQYTMTETLNDRLVSLTAAQNAYLDVSDFIVLNAATTVVMIGAGQSTGVNVWLVDRNNAQTLLDNNLHVPFSGYQMNDPSTTSYVHSVTLPAGQYFIYEFYNGNTLSSGQTTSAYGDVSFVTATGGTFAGTFAMAVSGDAGSWRAQGFTVTGTPDLYVKAESGAGKFVIMNDQEYHTFLSNPSGYINGTPPHIEFSNGFGAPNDNLEGEFQVGAGNYTLLWYNNSSSWDGGGAYVTAYAETSSSTFTATGAQTSGSGSAGGGSTGLGGTGTLARLLSSDFNGDGSSDILWRNASGALTTWLVKPAFPFIARTIIDQPSVTTDWVIQGTTDFNGDGKADIVWRNANSGALTIWNATGSGAFQVNSYSGGVADLNWKIAGLGDFNGDGKGDILWRNGATGGITVWTSTGSDFSVSAVNSGVADLNWKIAGVADFNGDGKADLLWRNAVTGDFTEWSSSGQGAVGWAVFSETTIPTDWAIVGAADFNGDGKADILWRNNTSGALSIWASTGTAFNSVPIYQDGSVADLNWKIQQTGDYNGDGKADILWRNTATGQLSVWINVGLGSPLAFYKDAFADSAPTEWSIVRTPTEGQAAATPAAPLRALGDFNGDGSSDILWRNASGAMTTWQLSAGGSGVVRAIVNQPSVTTDWVIQGTTDFNGDGKADIVWRNANSGALTIWNATGSGAFQVNSYSGGVADLNWKIAGLGDFNGDGKGDILWRNGATGGITVWTSTGSDFSVSAVNSGVADLNWKIAGVADFNGDGKADLLWRSAVTGDFTEWSSSGQGAVGWAVFSETTIPTDWAIVGAADFNGDGKADILWRNNTSGALSIWASTGTAFNSVPIYQDGSVADLNWKIQQTGDYNGDGKADILWRNTATGQLSVWTSTGTGFVKNALFDSAPNDWSIAHTPTEGQATSLVGRAPIEHDLVG